MPEQSTQLVQKLWNYCNILRDDGLSYLLARHAQASGDYPSTLLRTGSEQLTFLLFLKMADEQSRPPFNKPARIPKGFDWASLLAKDGDELEIHYRHLLETLGKEKGKLDALLVNLENSPEESKIGINARSITTKDEESTRSGAPAFSLEDFETGVVSVNPGWLKEVWNNWPGDETIEELLALLDDGE